MGQGQQSCQNWKKSKKLFKSYRVKNSVAAAEYEPVQKHKVTPGILGWLNEDLYRPWPKFNQLWRWSGWISMPNFRPFLSCVFQKMPGNPIVWPVWLSQNAAKMRKINRAWPKCDQFWRWSRYFSILPMHFQENAANSKFDLFHCVKMASKWGKLTDCNQNLIISEGG